MITSGREAMNRRVLVIDDNESIHDDFRKVLMPTSAADDDLLMAEAELFGEPVSVVDRVTFELTFASQGQQGHQLVKDAVAAGRPFAMAFVDMRMPPGWDGLETIVRIWADCPDIEMVICTAFSDYSWDEIVRRLGRTDRLLIVKKPFDQVEILQVASALTHKWNLQQEARRGLENLNAMVEERTRDLRAARDQLLALNGELLAAREAAEAANRSKTMFLANISHELRTPMTAILGYSEELQERFSCSLGSSIECDALETIRRNAKHMVGIIGDLLDIAKLEAGKLTADVGCCAPLHVLAEVVELLQAKATESAQYVQEALQRYPDIDVTTTTEVHAQLVALSLAENVHDSGISEAVLQAKVEAAAAQSDAVFDASDLVPSSIGLAVIALSVFMKKDASLREKGEQFGQRSAKAGVSASMGKVAMVVTQTWWIALIGGVATGWLAGRGLGKRGQYEALRKALEVMQERQKALPAPTLQLGD